MKGFARGAVRVVEALSYHSALGAVIALWAILIVIMYGLIMRYAFHNPMPFAVEGASYLYMPLCILGLAYIQLHKAHTSITGIVDKLPSRARLAAAVFALMLFLAFCGLVAYGGFRGALELFQLEELSPDMRMPLWLVGMFVPIGTTLLFLQVLIDLGKAIGQISGAAGRRS